MLKQIAGNVKLLIQSMMARAVQKAKQLELKNGATKVDRAADMYPGEKGD